MKHLQKTLSFLKNSDNQIKDVVYAGFWIRFAAFLVDTIILIIIILPILNIAEYNGISTKIHQIIEQKDIPKTIPAEHQLIKHEDINILVNNKAKKTVNKILLFISGFYSILFLSSKKQGTPGKQLFKLMVIDNKVGKVGILTALIRFIAKQLSNFLFGFGYLVIFVTKERTALHDIMCNTRVVRVK